MDNEFRLFLKKQWIDDKKIGALEETGCCTLPEFSEWFVNPKVIS